MKRIFAILLAIHLLTACSERYSPEVLHALQCSGANRAELETTLAHFAQHPADSLQLRAAQFLIGNMPGHYSLRDAAIERCIEEKYSNLPLFITNTLFCGLQSPSGINDSAKVEDVSIITADFLIGHINRSFARWRSVPWGREIPFGVFCEYMLPYRMGCEPLERIMRDTAVLLTDSLLAMLNSCGIAIREFKQNASYQLREVKQNYPYRLPAILGRSDEYAALVLEWKDCLYSTYRELSLYRKKGIPAYVDRTLHWSGRNGGHHWSGCIDPYAYKESTEDPFVTTAKVYRQTYARNKIPASDSVSWVPDYFTDPFLKDVTDVYFKTFDVAVTLTPDTSPPKYAYLAVFNEQKWQPVAWAKVKGWRATFTKMGGGAAYLPLYYDREKEISGGYPFTVDAHGIVKNFTPDTSSLVSLCLTRKSNLTLEKVQWSEMLVKLAVEASNSLSFKRAKPLYAIDNLHYIDGTFYHRGIDSTRSYRYYRVSQPDKSDFTVAELELYTADSTRLIPKAAIINGKRLPMKADGGAEARKVFDGNYLTYTTFRRSNVKEKSNSAVFDFGKPVRVAEIRVAPRNDENYVYPGNLYELLYRDARGWVSMGKKIAESYAVTYDSVPSGAMYWLRNHTRGKEERIFTFEHGNIKFW